MYCGETTYVHDLALASAPARTAARSNEPGIGAKNVALRSSQGGRKKKQNSFCRVTTRPGLCRRQSAAASQRPDHQTRGGEHAAPARWRHAAHAPRTAAAGAAAVSPPASAAVPAGRRDRGSSVDSTAAVRRRGRTPCADRFAREAVGGWLTPARRWYADAVPREVLSPNGAARVTRLSHSGTFFPPSPLDGRDPPQFNYSSTSSMPLLNTPEMNSARRRPRRK